MICPICECKTRVLETGEAAGEVKRRRECRSCGERFNTIERSEDAEIGEAARLRKIFKDLVERVEDERNRHR